MWFKVSAFLVKQQFVQFRVDVWPCFERQSKFLSADGQNTVLNPLSPLGVSQIDVARIDFPCLPYRLCEYTLASFPCSTKSSSRFSYHR